MSVQKVITIIVLMVLCVVFITQFFAMPTRADIESTVKANGGTIIIKSSGSWETANPLHDGFISREFDSYQSASSTSSIIASGRSAVEKTTSMKRSRAEKNTVIAETTGTMMTADSVGMFSTQVNIPESICETGNIELADYADEGRYPETQNAVARAGMIGTGAGTRYQSETQYDNKAVAISAEAETPLGMMFLDAAGHFSAGVNKSETILNYEYMRDDMIRVYSHENKTLDAVVSWLWDIDVEDVAAENITANKTMENENG